MGWLLNKEIVMRFKAEEKNIKNLQKHMYSNTSTAYRAMAMAVLSGAVFASPSDLS